MNKFLTTLIAVAISAALATSALAQGTGAGPKNGGQGQIGQGQNGKQGRPGGMRMGGGRKMQEEILAKLNLTPAQKTKITALQDKFRKEMETLRPKDGKPKQMTDAERQKLMAKFKAHNDALMAILTPAQKTQFEKLMKEAREKMRSQRGGPGGPGTPPPGGKGGKGKPPTV